MMPRPCQAAPPTMPLHAPAGQRRSVGSQSAGLVLGCTGYRGTRASTRTRSGLPRGSGTSPCAISLFRKVGSASDLTVTPSIPLALILFPSNVRAEQGPSAGQLALVTACQTRARIPRHGSAAGSPFRARPGPIALAARPSLRWRRSRDRLGFAAHESRKCGRAFRCAAASAFRARADGRTQCTANAYRCVGRAARCGRSTVAPMGQCDPQQALARPRGSAAADDSQRSSAARADIHAVAARGADRALGDVRVGVVAHHHVGRVVALRAVAVTRHCEMRVLQYGQGLTYEHGPVGKLSGAVGGHRSVLWPAYCHYFSGTV